jgi:hypothetical protein
MKKCLFSLRALALRGLVAAFAAGPAQAATTSVDTSACSNPLLTQPFLSANDSNWYTLLPGETPGNFDGPGLAPVSFKGFAVDATPTCGQPWTTDPGNSSHPPATIADTVPVIVSSTITKSGPVISGDATEVVDVAVDPRLRRRPWSSRHGNRGRHRVRWAGQRPRGELITRCTCAGCGG